jgi:hypothetical protein
VRLQIRTVREVLLDALLCSDSRVGLYLTDGPPRSVEIGPTQLQDRRYNLYSTCFDCRPYIYICEMCLLHVLPPRSGHRAGQ